MELVNMSPPHGQLSALVALIADATKTVETHFAKSSKPYVPSLDDVEPHPLDIISDSMELRLAIQTIEGACAQLMATVARPSHTVFNKAQVVGFLSTGILLVVKRSTQKLKKVTEPACLNIIVSNKIADLLSEQPVKGMHVSEISKRTGLHQNKIERIMRYLATKHIFREDSEGVFVNNRLSVQLKSSTNLGLVNTIHYNTEELLGAITCFNDVLTDKEWGHSDAPHHTAFNRNTGYPLSLFDYYSGEDSPLGAKLGERFGISMQGWGIASEASTMIYEFPWRDLPKGTTVVDVGSGIGPVTLQLAKQYPALDLTLQDLPERMYQAKNEVWPRECPEALAEGRVHFRAIDFFTQSPIPGADIYYYKNIIHDWEDQRCITILKNLHKSLTPNSRVLIHEYVLQDVAHVSDDKYGVKKAPEPLLPNYGVGRVRPYALDIAMMIMTNSSERRLHHLVELAEKANLKFVKLWDLAETSIVEFGLLDDRVLSGQL